MDWDGEGGKEERKKIWMLLGDAAERRMMRRSRVGLKKSCRNSSQCKRAAEERDRCARRRNGIGSF